MKTIDILVENGFDAVLLHHPVAAEIVQRFKMRYPGWSSETRVNILITDSDFGIPGEMLHVRVYSDEPAYFQAVKDVCQGLESVGSGTRICVEPIPSLPMLRGIVE